MEEPQKLGIEVDYDGRYYTVTDVDGISATALSIEEAIEEIFKKRFEGYRVKFETGVPTNT